MFENSFKLEVKLRGLSLNLICLHWLQLCKYLGLVLAALAQVFATVRKCLQVLVDGSFNLQNFAKYQYITRDPSVPFPDLDRITLVAAWPFMHDEKLVDAEDIDRAEDSFDLKAIKNDKSSEILSAIINVKLDRLRQICKFHG